MLKPVYFLRPYTLYNSGEVAGFPEAEAAELIKRGIARAARSYATLDELEAEVAAAGYKGKAAKSIAKERFEGVHGEEARYLAPEETVEEADSEELSEARKAADELVSNPELDKLLELEAQQDAPKATE